MHLSLEVAQRYKIFKVRIKNLRIKIEDKERSGALKKFEDKEFEEIFDEDRSQTLTELGKILQVDDSTVSESLKVLGMIQ